MPDFASAIKTEISRIAKKVAKQQVEPARKASSTQRHEIAELKREVAVLRREVSRLMKSAATPAASAPQESARGLRFAPRALSAHRTKLGLSAEQYGKLIGASGQSVYKWEEGKATPRQKQLTALASVRGIGKREALRKLAE